MANKLEFFATMDASGFTRGMEIMNAKVKAASGQFNKTMYGLQSGRIGMSDGQIKARAEYAAEQERKAKVRADRASLADAMATGREKAAKDRQMAEAAAAQQQRTYIEKAAKEKRLAEDAEIQKRQARISQFRQTLQQERAIQQQSVTAAVSAGREGRANKMFGASAASSMFISVARDSAASLASGAPAMTVIAQQAPQVLQALAMMQMAALSLKAILGALVVGGFYIAIKNVVDNFNRVEESARIAERSVSRLKGSLSIRSSQQRSNLFDASTNLANRRSGEATADAARQQRQTEHDADIADLRSRMFGKPDSVVEKAVAELKVKQARENFKKTFARTDIGQAEVDEAKLKKKGAEFDRQQIQDRARMNLAEAKAKWEADNSSVNRAAYVAAKVNGGFTEEMKTEFEKAQNEIKVSEKEIAEATKQADIKTAIAPQRSQHRRGGGGNQSQGNQ